MRVFYRPMMVISDDVIKWRQKFASQFYLVMSQSSPNLNLIGYVVRKILRLFVWSVKYFHRPLLAKNVQKIAL